MGFLRRHRRKLIVVAAIVGLYVSGYVAARWTRMLIRVDEWSLLTPEERWGPRGATHHTPPDTGFVISAGHHGDALPDPTQTAIADALYITYWPLAQLEGAAWSNGLVPSLQPLQALRDSR